MTKRIAIIFRHPETCCIRDVCWWLRERVPETLEVETIH